MTGSPVATGRASRRRSAPVRPPDTGSGRGRAAPHRGMTHARSLHGDDRPAPRVRDRSPGGCPARGRCLCWSSSATTMPTWWRPIPPAPRSYVHSGSRCRRWPPGSPGIPPSKRWSSGFVSSTTSPVRRGPRSAAARAPIPMSLIQMNRDHAAESRHRRGRRVSAVRGASSAC